MIAEFHLQTPAMRTALRSASQIDVSIVQQTPADNAGLDVVLNAARGDFEAFEAGLYDDRTVVTWNKFSAGEKRRRYCVTLTGRGRELFTYTKWSGAGAVFLDGHRRRTGWRFRIQFPDEESLQEYVSFCEDSEIEFRPIRLSRTNSSTVSERFGLTSTQTQTLVTASRRGFFEIPRECSLEDLAEEYDITHQALSERLRRGTESLVDSTLR